MPKNHSDRAAVDAWPTRAEAGNSAATESRRSKKQIAAKDRNPELAYTEYWNKDYSGIFLWALEGFRRLNQTKQFTESTSQKELIDNIKETSSPEVQWLKDHYKESEGCRISKHEIYEKFKKSAYDNDWSLCKSSKFYDTMRLLFPNIVMSDNIRVEKHGKKVRAVLNLGTIPAKSDPI